MDISPQDRDLVIRTVMGEIPPNDSDASAAGVASVILNRTASGQYGNSPSDVVLSRGQFEPWSTRPRELLSYSSSSPEYQRVGSIIDGLVSGNLQDPSGGATHFLNPAIVRMRRGGSLPNWAQKPIAQLGEHTYYAPYGRVAQNNSSLSDADLDQQLRSIGSAIAAKPQAAPMSDEDVDAGLRSFGFNTGTQAKPPPIAPNAPSPEAINPHPGIPHVPGANPEGEVNPTAPDWMAGQSSLPQRLEELRAMPSEALSSVGNTFLGGWDLAGKGINALRSGDILPSGFQWVPGKPATTLTGEQVPTWAPSFNSAGGAAETVGGVASMASSPFAVTDPLGKLVGQVTGNPDFGEKLPMMLPGYSARSIGVKAAGAAPALDLLPQLIGHDNIPGIIQRLEDNPRLSLADVSEPAKTLAGGLAADPALGAQDVIAGHYDQRITDRTNIVTQAIQDELGASPNVKKTLDKYKADIRKTGKDIGPILDKTGVVDLSPVVASVDQQLGPELLKTIKSGQQPSGFNAYLSPEEQKLLEIRKKIIGSASPEGDIAPEGAVPATMRVTSAAKAHDLQSQLRSEASTWMASANGSERHIGGTITMPLRMEMVKAIDDASGGTYAPALTKYREQGQVDEAFRKGFEILKKSGDLEDFPEYWQSWSKEASGPEKKAAQLGALTAIRAQIGDMQNGARRGETLLDREFVRDKAATLFPKQRVDDLAGLLNDAKDMTATNARLFQGTKTATTTAAANALRVPEVGSFGTSGMGASMIGTALGLGGHGLEAAPFLLGSALHGTNLARQFVQNRFAISRNRKLADYLMSGDGPIRDELMQYLRSQQTPVGTGLIQRLGGAAQNPLATGFGGMTPPNALATPAPAPRAPAPEVTGKTGYRLRPAGPGKYVFSGGQTDASGKPLKGFAGTEHHP